MRQSVSRSIDDSMLSCARSLTHRPSTPAPLPLVCRAALALVFYCLAVTVEDLMHDSSVIELLWTSCGDSALVEAIDDEEVAMKVRTWIGELLSRSLLLILPFRTGWL